MKKINIKSICVVLFVVITAFVFDIIFAGYCFFSYPSNNKNDLNILSAEINNKKGVILCKDTLL